MIRWQRHQTWSEGSGWGGQGGGEVEIRGLEGNTSVPQGAGSRAARAHVSTAQVRLRLEGKGYHDAWRGGGLRVIGAWRCMEGRMDRRKVTVSVKVSLPRCAALERAPTVAVRCCWLPASAVASPETTPTTPLPVVAAAVGEPPARGATGGGPWPWVRSAPGVRP